MKKVWFLFEKEFVSGPFTTEDMLEILSSPETSEEARVWWNTSRDWVRKESWLQNYKAFEEDLLTSEPANWFAERAGETYGPSTKSDLIQLLTNLENLSSVKVWKKGQERWASIYQHRDIADSLGISRRKHPRAPLVGQISIEIEGINQIGQATTVSAGGVGLKGIRGLQRDKEVSLIIRSPLLITPIHCNAIIRHVEDDLVGMEFSGLTSEYQATIVDYVTQFQKDKKSAA